MKLANIEEITLKAYGDKRQGILKYLPFITTKMKLEKK